MKVSGKWSVSLSHTHTHTHTTLYLLHRAVCVGWLSVASTSLYNCTVGLLHLLVGYDDSILLQAMHFSVLCLNLSGSWLQPNILSG